jgi:hypothetical protein
MDLVASPAGPSSPPVSQELRDRAEARVKKKEIDAREGAKAMADYQAASRAVSEKTARLRLLRLEKEAAEAKAATQVPTKSKERGASGKSTPGTARPKRR